MRLTTGNIFNLTISKQTNGKLAKKHDAGLLQRPQLAAIKGGFK